MVKITKNLHSIEGIAHPDPRGKVFPYLFIEENQDDLTLIDPSFLPSFHNYLYLKTICLMQVMILRM
jgi:hypothetical protein